MENVQKQWLNPREVSQEFGLSVSTLAKWRMNRTHLSFHKQGKFIKYKRADIEAYLNTNIVNTIDEVA